MTTTTKHSPKALTTMAGMGVATDAWTLTPIKWENQIREVRTKVACPTCRGRGVVRSESAKRGDYAKCPTCPTGRRYSDRGVGHVYDVVEREVQVGIIQWPTGTRFDSRFGSGCTCSLCGRLVLKSHMVAFHGADADGQVHGMMVGEDCARRLLGLTSFDAGVRDEATGELVRDVPKVKPAPKPEGPTITKATPAELESLVRETYGATLWSIAIYETKSSIEVSFTFDPEGDSTRRQGREFKITARHGAVLKTWMGDAVVWRDRTAADTLAALRTALAAAR
ncbi:hypothetical protein D3C72_844680 [compost metagenome]